MSHANAACAARAPDAFWPGPGTVRVLNTLVTAPVEVFVTSPVSVPTAMMPPAPSGTKRLIVKLPVKVAKAPDPTTGTVMRGVWLLPLSRSLSPSDGSAVARPKNKAKTVKALFSDTVIWSIPLRLLTVLPSDTAYVRDADEAHVTCFH